MLTGANILKPNWLPKPFKRPRINYLPPLKSQNWALGSKNPWNKMNSMSQWQQAQLSKIWEKTLIDSRNPVQRVFHIVEKFPIFIQKSREKKISIKNQKITNVNFYAKIS